MNKKDNRGGIRQNAGRKKGDKETFPVRCLRENILKIRNYIKDNNL